MIKLKEFPRFFSAIFLALLLIAAPLVPRVAAQQAAKTQATAAAASTQNDAEALFTRLLWK